MTITISSVIFGIYVIYKIIIGFGRKNAKDFLVANYGLNRSKLKGLSDPQLTSLTISLESFAKQGNKAGIDFLVKKYQ